MAIPALAQAPGAKEGPIIAYTEDLWLSGTQVPIDQEKWPISQIWGLQAYPYVPVMSYEPQKAQNGAFDPCSCVSYIKSRRPDLTEAWGTPKAYAQTHQGSSVPWDGAVGISREGPVWHAFYVEDAARGIISEYNYVHCQKTTRTIPNDVVAYY